MFVAFAVTLWSSDRALVVLASVAAAIGVAAYFPSNTAIEMLTVAGHHATADGAVLVVASRAAAETLLATGQGKAFVTYCVLSGVALLVYSAAMWRGGPFGRHIAAWGLVAGALMCVPPVAGTLGLVFAILSPIPWTVFSLRVARTLWSPTQWR